MKTTKPKGKKLFRKRASERERERERERGKYDKLKQLMTHSMTMKLKDFIKTL